MNHDPIENTHSPAGASAPAAALSEQNPWRVSQIIARVLWTLALLAYANYAHTMYRILDGGARDGHPVGDPKADVTLMAWILLGVSVLFTAGAFGAARRLPRWMWRRGWLRPTPRRGLVMLLAWAVPFWFVNGIGIYGLVLSLMTRDTSWFWMFAVPGFIASVALMPRWGSTLAELRARAAS